MPPAPVSSVALQCAEPRPTAAQRVEPAFQSALGRALAEVPPTRTALSGDQAASALERAWTERFGRMPSRETLSILTAQWAHETGRGASMYNFNFGGIKGSGPSGLFVEQRTREGHGESERRIVDRFRAYQSPEEGATDYLALLASRYPGALRGAEAGDPKAFVEGLKAKAYFTGDSGAYTRAVSSMSRAALAQGFGALGAGGKAVPARLDAPVMRSIVARSDRTERAMNLTPDGVAPVDTPFVSTLAIADELGRSAVRILAGDSEGEHVDRPIWGDA